MPAGLSSHLTQDDYSASMARIQSANRSPLGARLLMLVAWLAYVVSLLQVCGLFGVGVNGVMYGGYYVNGTWLGWIVGLVSLVSLISLARYSRKRRFAQVSAAVAMEHATYSNRVPALAWRVVDERFIEIDVVDASQHHIAALEHQVHILQAQVAAQAHHQAVDHELLAHQAAAAHHAPPHYAAPAASPSGSVAPPPFHVQYYPTVAEPVYAQPVYQPAPGSVFAHPPPQYYTAQPRTELRQPLVQYQY